MNKALIIAFSFFTFGILSSAHAQIGRIAKLSKSKDKAIILMKQDMSDMQIQRFVVMGPEKKLCSLKVIKISGRKALVNAKECPFKDSLKVGQKSKLIKGAPMDDMMADGPMDNNPDEPAKPMAMADKGRSIKDIMYMPHKSKWYYQGDIYRSQTIATSKATGATETETETTSMTLDQELGWGFRDHITFNFEFDYVTGSESKSNVAGTNATNSAGMEDPSFGVNYRWTKGPMSKMHFDTAFKFSPGIGDSEVADANNDGNALRGGHQIFLNTTLGKKGKKFHWASYLSLWYNMERTLVAAGPGSSSSKTTVDPFMDLTIAGVGQYDFSPNFYAIATLGYTMYGDVVANAKTNGTLTGKSTTERGGGFLVDIGGGYMISKEKMLLLFNYIIETSDNNTKTTDASGSSLATTTGASTTGSVRFGLRWQF